jgi:uncharacterized coiled-coil DUF342 family protein
MTEECDNLLKEVHRFVDESLTLIQKREELIDRIQELYNAKMIDRETLLNILERMYLFDRSHRDHIEEMGVHYKDVTPKALCTIL